MQEQSISGKRWEMQENPMGIRWISLSFGETDGILRYENSRGTKEIFFGCGSWHKTEVPEIYSGYQIDTPYHKGYDTYAIGQWADSETFRIQLKVTDIFLGTEISVPVLYWIGLFITDISKRLTDFYEDHDV
ncbi:MAG: hypothetical protein E7462_06845 [Ruminococcaceae bacterium]|nr:hypothetical protein [Oscillospiraceae bacterium]